MVAEATAGRKLLPNEVVHHKNRKRDDDAPDNLEIMDEEAHRALHNALRACKPRSRKPDSPTNRRYVWPTKEELESRYAVASIRQIADELGCNFKSVHRHMQKVGIALRRRGPLSK